MTWTQFVLTRSRVFVGIVVSAVLVTAVVNGGVSPAVATEPAAPVVGSFGVGGDVSGGINERTGGFDFGVPVLALPGLGGAGSVDVGVSYDQGLAGGGVDRFGLGAGLSWSGSFVDVNGGVRVFPASGGVYDGDASEPSGLRGYTLGDVVFRQESGVLPERDGVGVVEYAFSLASVGGVTDYFSATGDVVARIDVFGARVDWLWQEGDSHRLRGIIDGGGSRATVVWTDAGVEVFAPVRSDGVQLKTVLEVTGSRLVSVTNPVGERVGFAYQSEGLVDQVISSVGAVTEVSYQELSDGSVAVDQVRVVDSVTSAQLSVREWDVVGAHLSSGWPVYGGQGALWGSGDDEFRYQTQLSDGSTRVVSEYNSQGLMVGRDVVVSSAAGDVVVQEQAFMFPGTDDGGVADPQLLPKQYQRPTNTTVVFRDDRGRSRTVSESTVFDDAGRMTKQVSTDGQVTENVYDTQLLPGMVLPVGLMVEQTVTGTDGTVAKTVNTLTGDHKAIQATETFVGSGDGLISQSRTEVTVESDGFVSEERVVATGEISEGPTTVVTRFDRIIDDNAKTITASQTNAAGTPAASTKSVLVDKATGLTMKTIDAFGRETSTTYDPAGRVVSETDPTGKITVTKYDNKVTRVTDVIGVTTSEYVDVLGQVVKVTDNLEVVDGVVAPVSGVERVIEQRAYEQNSSKVTLTDARGLETVTVSDVFGRVREVITPNGVHQITEYDDIANTARSGLVAGSGGLSDALLVSTTVKDDTDKVVKETSVRADYEQASDLKGFSVPESATRYDGLGRVTEQVSDDVSTSMVLNPDGTPKTVTQAPVQPEKFDGAPVTAVREHNVFGVSTKKTLTQPDGQARAGVSRVLDAAGQTVSETDQAGNKTVFEYTVDGLVALVRYEATGVVTRNTYDPITRALAVTETVAADGTVSVTEFEYDPVTVAVVGVYDPTDREGTRVGYEYDVLGNVTRITYPDSKTITHTFDEHGREITSTDIVGNITAYEYDRFGVLAGVKQASPEGVVLADVRYEYDGLGRMVKLSRGNDVVTQYTFTSANEVKRESTRRGDTIISDASYEYDTHGNLTKRVDTRQPTGQESSSDTPVTETTVYGYDVYNRLVASSVYDGVETEEPRQHTEYQITVSGDVAQEKVTVRGASGTSPTVSVRDFEYNMLGQLRAVVKDGVRAAQEYDEAGNLTLSADGTRYTYNPHNQAVTETRLGGPTIETTYWVTGQRQNTTTIPADATENPVTGAETVRAYWDDATLVNDTHTTEKSATPFDEVTASYLIGTSRHTRTVSSAGHVTNTGDTDYYATDRHGNVTHLIGDTGHVTVAYTYTDYGQTTTSTPNDHDDTGMGHRNPFQYAGEYTTLTGNQPLGDRIYDPTMMRFTTKDSAQLHNLYAYANANPITMVDPTGQTSEWDLFTSGLIAAVGLALAVIGFAASIWSGGLTLTLANAGIVISGLIDVGIATSQAIDTFADEFIMDPVLSTALTAVSLALGGLALLTGLGKAGITKFKQYRAKKISDHDAADITRFTATLDETQLINVLMKRQPPPKMKEVSKFLQELRNGQPLKKSNSDAPDLLESKSDIPETVEQKVEFYNAWEQGKVWKKGEVIPASTVVDLDLLDETLSGGSKF